MSRPALLESVYDTLTALRGGIVGSSWRDFVFTLLTVTFPEGFLKKEVLAVKKYSSESSSKLL